MSFTCACDCQLLKWDAMSPGGAVSLHCSWVASLFLAGDLLLQGFEGSPGQGCQEVKGNGSPNEGITRA